MRQCGNEGRRAMRSGAPAVTPGDSAQAGSAQCPVPNASRSVNCRTAALPHCRIDFVPYASNKKSRIKMRDDQTLTVLPSPAGEPEDGNS